MKRVSIMLVIAAVAASSAHAGEAISTAGGAGASPAASAPAAAPIMIPEHDAFDRDIQRTVGPCGGVAKTPDGKPDKNPHGEVFAGVGTHGYREAGGVVCVPMGDHAAATIAIDVGQSNGRSGWRR